MANGVTIREATSDDVSALTALNKVVQDVHVAAVPGYFKPHDAAAVSE